MRSMWLVARYEYLRMVRRRSFLVATFGAPLLIIAVSVISGLLAVGGQGDALPLGFVDQAGAVQTLASREQYAGEGDVEIRAFPDEETALAALEAGELQAVFILPPGYKETRQVALRYWQDLPAESTQSVFRRFLRASLAQGQPPEVQSQLLRGLDLTLRSASDGRELGADSFVSFLLPLVLSIAFVFVVMGSAGYLLQAVTTEKENRTVEVMFTSVSPEQFIVGKALGLMAVALTQVLLWAAALAVGVLIAARYASFLQGLTVSWQFALFVVLFFLPTYALVAGMMIALGSMVPSLENGQQIAGVVNLLFVIPLFFLVMVLSNPDSPVMIALTLFPTTSLITIAMRWGVTTIPAWQLILSWGILVTAAALSVWVAARVFRVGMLRYGQPLSLRGLSVMLRARPRQS